MSEPLWCGTEGCGGSEIRIHRGGIYGYEIECQGTCGGVIHAASIEAGVEAWETKRPGPKPKTRAIRCRKCDRPYDVPCEDDGRKSHLIICQCGYTAEGSSLDAVIVAFTKASTAPVPTQTPQDLLRGVACPICGQDDKEFMYRYEGDLFDHPRTVYGTVRCLQCGHTTKGKDTEHAARIWLNSEGAQKIKALEATIENMNRTIVALENRAIPEDVVRRIKDLQKEVDSQVREIQRLKAVSESKGRSIEWSKQEIAALRSANKDLQNKILKKACEISMLRAVAELKVDLREDLKKKLLDFLDQQ